MDTLIIDRSKKWTEEDYLQLEGDVKCEILNGELIMTPAPLVSHQRVVGQLYQNLIAFVNRQQVGELFFAPVDAYFDRENIYQPDLVFVSAPRASVIQEKGIMGAPDLVAEVISPSNSYIDRYAKKEKYEQFGVKEYWIADPANKTLEIFTTAVSGKYELFWFVATSGRAKSKLLSGLDFELSDIFK
ncbi:MAG TPA: Uma2 family endonuclease [Cyclobacteriaceae bacterium]|nr:Uma2 family endonuclease [Cyclobacteriaceae bacterium]